LRYRVYSAGFLSHQYCLRLSYLPYSETIGLAKLTIIIIIIIITFMHGMYNYIPETNHVSRVHSVAAGTYNVTSHVGLVLLN